MSTLSFTALQDKVVILLGKVDSLTDQWTTVGLDSRREDSGIFRLDHRFTDKTSIFGRVWKTFDSCPSPAPSNSFTKQTLLTS